MAQSCYPYSSVTIPLLPGFPVPVGNWWFEVWDYHGTGAMVSLCLMMEDDDGDDDADEVMSPPTCGYAPTGHLHGLARC